MEHQSVSDLVERLRADPYRNFTEAIEEIYDLLSEIERLRKDVDHWREARRSCIEAGDMMKEEIERLRGLLLEWLDMLRLIREGKPVPLDFVEKRVREALGND